MRPVRPEHATGLRIDDDRSAGGDRRSERRRRGGRRDERSRRPNRLRGLRLRPLDLNGVGLGLLRGCAGRPTVGPGVVKRERRSPGGKRRNDDYEESGSTPA